MSLFYLSFASERAFLGATVVESATSSGALAEATRRGLNPGGEVAILMVPADQVSEPDVQAMRNRLLSERQMLELGARKNVSRETQRAFAREARVIPEQRNLPPRTSR